MKTKPWAIVLMVLSTLITASGQFLFKVGAERLPDNLFDIHAHITNWPLILGCALYAVALGLFIISLRGGELSVLYPVLSLGFVWVTAVSVFFLHEQFNIAKAAGVGAVLVGVALIGWGSQR